MNARDAETVGLVGCPDCGVRRGMLCVYMPVLYPSQDRGQVGNPIPSAIHRSRAHRAAGARRQATMRAEVLLPPPPANVAARIAQAESRWEQDERARLVTWLAVWSPILTEIGSRS